MKKDRYFPGVQRRYFCNTDEAEQAQHLLLVSLRHYEDTETQPKWEI